MVRPEQGDLFEGGLNAPSAGNTSAPKKKAARTAKSPKKRSKTSRRSSKRSKKQSVAKPKKVKVTVVVTEHPPKPDQPNEEPKKVEIPQLEPGLYEKITPEIYHGQKAISRSDLVNPGNTDTPWTAAKFKYFKDHPLAIKPPTEAQKVGDAFHTRILEPSLFETRFVLSRFPSFRTKEAQIWADEQHRAGLSILTADQMDMIIQMEMAAREHPHFSTVFRRAKALKEVTLIARDPNTGLLLRARYDLLPMANFIPDLKSTKDASPEGFGKQIWDKGYGFQAAFYLKVYNLVFPNDKRDEFIFFAFEKEPPFICDFYSTPHPLMEYCESIIRARLYMIAHAAKSGRWPAYRDEITPLGKDDEPQLPRWAVKEIEDFQKHGE